MHGQSGDIVTASSALDRQGVQDADLPSAHLEFGPFSLRDFGEALYRGDARVRLGSRARQILVVLTAAPTRVVSKAELIRKVWPDTTVVDNNLTVHVAALRQALGDGRDGAQYIVNVPGRGYRFVAPVFRKFDDEGSRAIVAVPPSPTNLPVRLRPAVSLATPIDAVCAKLSRSNLVTVCGPAGVGKTTLAQHVAQARRPLHPDGVWLIDLAALTEPRHVPLAIATMLKIEAWSENPTTVLLQTLARSNALLLLDSCEHLIDAVADLTAEILRHCPNVVVLATSRETLRVNGEAVYVLAPLDAPPDLAGISAKDALSYPAARLLIDRVAAAANAFTLSDEDAFFAARVCRRLDGLPLAIEFAAALVGVFSLADIASRLDDLFRMLQSNMRGAPLRHRTLTAALDWSYRLLTDGERAALRQLAVFAGGFSLEGAAAVTGIEDLAETGALLAKLHAKSLITRDVASPDLRFRLLETTRAYALERLKGNGDEHEILRRHAQYYCAVLRKHRVQAGAQNIPRDATDRDNIRSALRFAIGPRGDLDLVRSLTSDAWPVWHGLSLMDECRTRLQDVLAQLTPDQAPSPEEWDPGVTVRITERVKIGSFIPYSRDGSAPTVIS